MSVAGLHDALANLLIGRYSTAATLTVLMYDYLATLDTEVAFYWSRKFSYHHILFFVNRYIPFIYVTAASHYILNEQNFDYCKRGLIVFVVFNLVGVLSAELVFLLRADAVWGHRPILRVFLIGIFTATGMIFIVFSAKHLASAQVMKGLPAPGCLYSFSRRNWASVLTFAACDFFAFVLLFTKNEMDIGLARTALMRSLYLDSVACFSIILVLTALNLALQIKAPPTLLDVFIVPEVTVVNIMCCRLLLGIQRVHEGTYRSESLV